MIDMLNKSTLDHDEIFPYHLTMYYDRGCVSTGATGAMAPVNFDKAYLALVKF